MKKANSLVFHLLLLGLCSWAVYFQLTYRIPGSSTYLVLPLVNVVAGCLTAIIMVLHLMGRTPVEEPLNSIFFFTEKFSRIFILLFCFYGQFVLVNARWDASRPKTVRSRVLELRGAEINLGHPIHYFWVKLRSWSDPQKTEQLPLHLYERKQLWIGRTVLLQLHQGYFNIPWVSAIEPDKEKELKAILELRPTASQPHRELAYFYLDQHRWSDATSVAENYMRLYPNEYIFVRYVAGILLNARQFSNIILLLEPIAQRKPDYQVFVHLGFALAMKGRKPEGIRYLKAAITMEPHDYWAYYALGYAHVFTGAPRAAVPYFEKVLEIRPNYPEIEEQLRRIRESSAEAHLNSKLSE